MNVKLLRRIQKQLEAAPESFQMTFIADKRECGTACCIAGWAIVLGVKEKLEISFTKFLQNSNGVSFGAPDAQKLLGKGSSKLFFVGDWPLKFQTRWDKATTDRKRADIAIQRIDHFIKTKGAE